CDSCHAGRRFCGPPLAVAAPIACTKEQANYLLNVLRLRAGADIPVFNGRDGESRARPAEGGQRCCPLECLTPTRPQRDGPDVHYLFAPLKHARLDYMVQKAT